MSSSKLQFSSSQSRIALSLLQRAFRELRRRELLRFNLLLSLFAFGILFMPVLLYQKEPELLARLSVVYLIFLFAAWAFVLFKAHSGLQTIKAHPHDLRVCANHKIRQLVLISLYKEPLAIIEQTLESLTSQTIAHRLIVVIGFESRTPLLESKIARLRERFGGAFHQLHFTVHPFGMPGEIPGKCSNVNYSIRQMIQVLGLTENDYDTTLVTTCDSDNLFDPRHFEQLEIAFLNEPQRHATVWQAPLFYDWKSSGTFFLSRITGLSRAVHMLGALIPLQINTMSIQSVSLRLLANGDFYSPRYQMEDILNVVRWMTELGERVQIRLLPIPLISGPTSGATLWEEFREWRLQARRWSVGAAEVFHYFAVRSFQIPLKTRLGWGLSFVGYYYLYQMLSPLSLLLMSVLMQSSTTLAAAEVMGIEFRDWMSLALLMQTAWMLGLHVLHHEWTHRMGIGERVGFRTKLLDIALTPITLVGYSLVSFLALTELIAYGRLSCGHDPSSKEGLAEARTELTEPSREPEPRVRTS